MGLSHDGYTFGGSSFHGDIVAESDVQAELVEEKFFGLAGAVHVLGAPGGRTLHCQYDLVGYTQVNLGNQLLAISQKVTALVGTLTITGNIGGTYPKCTFLGYVHEPQFFDGSGVNGWCCFGRLFWRQRSLQ